LQEFLTPSARVYQLPGMSAEFTAFIDEIGQSKALLLILGNAGTRQLCEGPIDHNLTNESIVAVGRRNHAHPWIILRRDVVGWYKGSGVSGPLSDLAQALLEQGWSKMGSGY